MAFDDTSARSRLNDIADTLAACEREKVCGPELPQTAVPLLAEAERLGAFSGPEYAAVRLALARWRNCGTEPWDEVIGQKVETDPSVITYQRIVSALFPDLADTDEEELEFKIPRVGAGENTDTRAAETVRRRHKVGKCELHLWVNWAAAAPRIADKLRLPLAEPGDKTRQGEESGGGGDQERKLLMFLQEMIAYESAVRNARKREFFPLEAGHSLYDAVESLGTLPSPEPLGTWLNLRNRSRPCKTVKGWENRQRDILLKHIPALRVWAEGEVKKCRQLFDAGVPPSSPSDPTKGGAVKFTREVDQQEVPREPRIEAGRAATTKDVFLSHATADKETFVRPFANELDKRKVSYWLDEAEIHWGDSISRKIGEGLKHARFVVAFLSDAFVGRNWTESELAAALSRENAEGCNVVLPIVIGDAPRLLAEYPLLRDKAYLRWDIGVVAIADELQRLTNREWSKSELDQYIAEKVDLSGFEASSIWGDGYRLLGTMLSGDEGAWYFWNERERTVQKNWRDSVRWHGIQRMTQDDIEFVRAVVTGRPATRG